MAAAALRRLGLADRIAQAIDPEVIVPQVGQGAIAVECREDDETTAAQLAAVDDAGTRRAVEAERAFLATLGGGCTLPVGAHATLDGPRISLLAVIATPDGRVCLRHRDSGTDPAALGRSVADHLLYAAGGAELLELP
jgi:hydroxymethylbilane synthase